MIGEGPRYNHSAQAAQHIINILLPNDDPPAIRFAKILYTILQAMDDAEEEMKELRLIVSRN